MNCVYICHFSSEKVERMKKLKMYLNSRGIKTSDNNAKQFNWGCADKCKYGITCNKTSQAKLEFDRLRHELDDLLTDYINNKEYDDYHRILELLRGYFPQVYREFEIEIHKSK